MLCNQIDVAVTTVRDDINKDSKPHHEEMRKSNKEQAACNNVGIKVILDIIGIRGDSTKIYLMITTYTPYRTFTASSLCGMTK
jgi:hypothetical protein